MRDEDRGHERALGRISPHEPRSGKRQQHECRAEEEQPMPEREKLHPGTVEQRMVEGTLDQLVSGAEGRTEPRRVEEREQRDSE